LPKLIFAGRPAGIGDGNAMARPPSIGTDERLRAPVARSGIAARKQNRLNGKRRRLNAAPFFFAP
jgi:hypothetical protein